MLTRHRTSLVILALAVLTGCTQTETTQTSQATPAATAQLFDDMGAHRRTVTTDSAEAQAYFDQALTWMYSFNHDEAIRSFTKAAELDPDCAMAWWGVSLCHGPNYNDAEMTEERSSAAWAALEKAQQRLDDETPVERALIAALAHRYAMPEPADRSHLEKAYADAMAGVWAQFPDDPDVGALYAEALMVRRPWMLYDLEFTPAEDTPMIVATLERVLDMQPEHPGANHLYIHAVEPSADPYRGLVAAERLNDMLPASGHMLHMPSHIYVKTGHWDEAIAQNEKALRSDATYRVLSPQQGIQHMYQVHNAHMLAYAAMMAGQEETALRAARAMWANLPAEMIEPAAPWIDLWMCSIYDVQKRFGRWDELLAEPAPPQVLPITTAIWRAHRAIAYAARKDFANAQREYDAFRAARDAMPDDLLFGLDPASGILEVSEHFIAGELALQRGEWDAAALHLERAAAAEDQLSYGEPPQWLQPVRHTLGAVYLKAGRYADAERAYRQDLVKWPNNGWSLFGLSRALEGQGRTREAREAQREYEQAWAHADEKTTTSCKCIPQT